MSSRPPYPGMPSYPPGDPRNAPWLAELRRVQLEQHRTDRLPALALAVCAAMAAGVVALFIGMTIGQRDAQAAQAHDRWLAVRECAADGSLPVLIVRDPQNPRADQWTCNTGSQRLQRGRP